MTRRFPLSFCIYSDLWLPVTFRGSVTDRAPHVRPLRLTIASIFPKRILKGPPASRSGTRIRLSLSFQLAYGLSTWHSSYKAGLSPLLQMNALRTCFSPSYLAGEISSDVSDLLCLVVCSSTRSGLVGLTPATHPTWSATNLPSLACSPPTLPWLPLCFLDCSVCAVVAEACSVLDSSSGSR
jgi:hypothetical protein